MKLKDISKTKNKSLTLSDTEQNTILAATIDGLSSMFQEKQKLDVKQDTTLNIKWESEPDMIDVSGDITDIPPDSKD
jgi:hypothetical protein